MKLIPSLAVVSAMMLSASFGLSAQTPLYLNEQAPMEQRVEDALSRMTLQEKINMIHGQGKFSSAGVPRLGIPDLWMSDGPHGVRAEINWNDWNYSGRTNDSITAFPALTALAATWNPALAYQYGNAVGEEALYREKDVMLGPGVNIYRTPMNGRNFEYMGEDPYLASIMVVPYIQGLQKNGVAACVKHYALNNQELWRDHIDVDVSDRALYEIYLPAFKAAIVDGGAWSIMGAYNKIRGQHACHNDLTLNKILKDDWDFDGVVITDWGGAHDTDEAALNGLDLEMGTYTNGLTSESAFTTDDYYMANPYRDKIQKGELPQSTLDDKVRRLLRLNFRTAMNRNKPWGSVATPEHYALCEAIGNEAVVLLKNEPVNSSNKANKKDKNTSNKKVKKSDNSDKLLPIQADKYNKILVVGDNATRNLMQGGGSSELKPKNCVTVLDALKDVYGDKIEYAPGYAVGRAFYGWVDEIPSDVQQGLRKEAVEKAADANLVIFVGGLNKNHHQDCEGGDREEYGLPFEQPELIEELVQANPNTVVVLLSGNAVEMPWEGKVPAILQGWYLGSMGGKPIANVLSGRVNPSGKLPFSFPKRLEDNGAHYYGTISYPGDSIRQEYKEDILVGYRWHDTKKIPAKYPFGHGLSYTTFSYGKPQASSKSLTATEPLTITIDVTNTGESQGSETLQLYISEENPTVTRPIKELKAFQKVNLEKGETQTITFTLTPDALMFYDDQSGLWTANPGKFKAHIGSSSTDIRQSIPFTLDQKVTKSRSVKDR